MQKRMFVIFLLFLLIGLNALIRRLLPRPDGTRAPSRRTREAAAPLQGRPAGRLRRPFGVPAHQSPSE